MKKEVDISLASRLINPGMLILVSASDSERSTITPCAWHMPVSKEPFLLAVALSKKHFSSEAIVKSQEFIINIPCWAILDNVLICGKKSGREVDKFQIARLNKEKARVLTSIPVVEESSADLECRLIDTKEAGDHYIFLGEVVYAQADEELFSKGFWDTNRAELIFHLGGKNFFKSAAYVEV